MHNQRMQNRIIPRSSPQDIALLYPAGIFTDAGGGDVRVGGLGAVELGGAAKGRIVEVGGHVDAAVVLVGCDLVVGWDVR